MMDALDAKALLKGAITDLHERFTAANPLSAAADDDARRYLPGGNTRSVLHFDPFPLTMVRGEGAEAVDLDGHRYVDFVGEYSAGLFGHSEPRIMAAVDEALDGGVAMGAPTNYERRFAALLCERFPALDLVRFCNSGTEANLMALTTARAATGRNRLLAFRDSYHGSVIKFPGGNCEMNAPFDFVLSDFNDIEGTAELIHDNREELAAVIVEPVLGAGGNIQGNRDFLKMLRERTEEVGALLIFDEVKTARLGAAGVQGMLDFKPDLTTLGKFIAGGLPTGAFGGRADLMARYDPRHERCWNHAGTFNNDVCSMAAGCVAMGELFTPARGAEFLEWGEAFRDSLNRLFRERDVPMYANGLGSMIAIHFAKEPTKTPKDITAGCQSLRPLLHMEMLLEGVLICKRGDFFLSLPMHEAHLDKARTALGVFIDKHKLLIESVLASS
jgi:glutamate-1-semialdehyde 2,1-aminomutase